MPAAKPIYVETIRAFNTRSYDIPTISKIDLFDKIDEQHPFDAADSI